METKIDFNQVNNDLFDKDLRAKIRANPQEYVESFGHQMTHNSEGEPYKFVVKTNTKDTLYFAMFGPDMHSMQIEQIHAGVEASSLASVSSMGTVSSFGCAPSCVGSLGSASSAATLGSVKPSR